MKIPFWFTANESISIEIGSSSRKNLDWMKDKLGVTSYVEVIRIALNELHQKLEGIHGEDKS